MPISFILQFSLLNFLPSPFPVLFFCCFSPKCPTGAVLLCPCPVSKHHPSQQSNLPTFCLHSPPLTHQSRRAPRQSPISTGAPMSTCTAKPLFSLTEPQSFPSVSFHLVRRLSENSYVYESMRRETKERKQSGQKTHSCHV